MKRFILAGNWKLNLGPIKAAELAVQIVKKKWRCTDVVLFPSALSVASVIEQTKDTPIAVGIQNISEHSSGAWTGENSVDFAQELGCRYVLLGHSERRQFFSETNSQLAKKWQLVLQKRMIPVLCVGETLAERESGKTLQVLREQMQIVLDFEPKELPFVIAYEPVWAIGTGRVATSAQVDEVHRYLSGLLNEAGLSAPLLYGGSVKADNAKELSAIEHVHGFLVGGASLGLDTFWSIDQQLSL